MFDRYALKPMLVTLLSDFGTSDVYVGVMKGEIARINSNIQVVDLTHQIPPQNVAAGRFQLTNAYPYFPDGTVHVAIVDPGVGSQRRSIAVQLQSGYLVAPDNGLISGVLSQYRAIAAVELTNQAFWRTANPSTTFHGRDIFAPVGAYLASGTALRELGREIDLNTIVRLPIPDPIQTATGIQGTIQAIDHFGNLITTIPAQMVADRAWTIRIGDQSYPGKTTYAAVDRGEILGLIGSHGWVEIAANQGNAQQKLGAIVGSSIDLEFTE